MIHTGDCLEVMAAMEPESVDAIVTDPPYGLEFMGKEWDRLDSGLPQEAVWKGRRGQGGAHIGTDDSKPQSRHHVGYGGGQQGFKRCTTCGKRAFSGSPCVCENPTWVIEYNQGPPSSSVRMGRWHQQWAEAAYRVAKPSAYLLAFGGTRTFHRLACALEDAGWIIRDTLVWGYASGFPKSKASLKPAWEPIVMARKPGPLRDLAIDLCRIMPTSQGGSDSSGAYSTSSSVPWHTDDPYARNPSTVLRAWSDEQSDSRAALANALADAFVGRGVLSSRGGYPSCRHCDDGLARIAEAADRDDAPLRPDVPGAPPLLEWSVERIHRSRCDVHPSIWDELARVVAEGLGSSGNDTTLDIQATPAGRWPANVILTSPIFDGGWEGVVGGGETTTGDVHRYTRQSSSTIYGGGAGYMPDGSPNTSEWRGDSGTYSRFFLIPKADRADREPVLGGQVPIKDANKWNAGGIGERRRQAGMSFRENSHPTVKPTDLMRHLVRLVTPAQVPILRCDSCGMVVEYAHAVPQSSTKPDLQDVRSGVLRGSQADAVLQQEVRGSAHGAQSSWLSGLGDEPTGLHPRESAGSSDGEQGWLLDAASPDSGGDTGPDAVVDGSGRPHQRDQVRQPTGEPAGAGQAGARQPAEASEEADRVPALSLDDRDYGPCPACAGSLSAGYRPGRVLDPFLGSGTTAIAAEMEGFQWVGIEREPEYVAIAEARLNGVQKGLGLSAWGSLLLPPSADHSGEQVELEEAG